MTQPKLTLLKSLKVLFSRLFNGRIHFLKDYAGKILLMEDGKKFQIIRNLKVDPTQNTDKSVSVFKVRFKFSGLPLAVNKRLSIPVDDEMFKREVEKMGIACNIIQYGDNIDV